jgi:hypothetical protein
VQISRRTQLKFADFACDFAVLRLIDQVFLAEDFEPKPDYVGPEGGQRRGLVGAYHAAINFNDPEQVRNVVNVYVDAVNSWGRDENGVFYPGALDFIRSLRRDGLPINDQGELTAPLPTLEISLERFNRLGDPAVVDQHLQRIAANIDRDPAAAVASSKEVVESVCKFILDDYGVSYSPTDDLLTLYKAAAAQLKLNREAVPGSAKGSAAAHRVLQNLSTAVQSLAELRNELGLGHGRTTVSPAFARHARLAANAARTVVEFMLETWHERRRAGSSAA